MEGFWCEKSIERVSSAEVFRFVEVMTLLPRVIFVIACVVMYNEDGANCD